MSTEGTVEQIAIAAEPRPCPRRCRPCAPRRVTGSRASTTGRHAPEPGESITLIAAEALEGLREDTGIELSHEASRRNVLTRGIDLNPLVGRRFTIGGVECEGVELCDPCNDLVKLTERGVLRGLVQRGGLRADIVAGGEIAVGDPVRAS